MALKSVLFMTLTTGASIAALGCSVIVPGAEQPPAEDAFVTDPPAELIQPRPQRVRCDTGYYRGIVTAVGPDWLELGVGWEGQTVRKKQLDFKKPRRLSAAGTKAGGVPQGEGDPTTHRLTDLKIGDVVVVAGDISRSGEEWITEIEISRRPGGKIPPMPPDQFGGHTSIVEANQAEQDWEEKGVPIPKKFLDPQSRAPWTNPPYPPVAPEPRPAKP